MVGTATSSFGTSMPRQATYVVYINGLEVPAKSVSLRYGVWQMPEMQVEMVADPILARLGNEDRVQVAVFYYDDCDVDRSVTPAFRLFGEGEITGWGYRNTSAARSIVFTVVNQIAIFTQLFVQFMTTVDDMIGHETEQGDVAGYANATSQLVYPFALFKQGLLPGQGAGAPTDIVRPFDFLYNTVRGMMASNIPEVARTVPASNFFTRWARLTNFHNRFVASPFFDEPVAENAHVFPVLAALQNTAAIDVVVQNLIPNIQNAGSIWDMLQLVYTTMLMEVAMIPGMPLVTVDLSSGLVQTTDFTEHTLSPDPAHLPNGAWVSTIPAGSRKQRPKRLPNYFVKPQMLFSIPPTCNVLFPSQVLSVQYDEAYMKQPTRLYFNDELVPSVLKMPKVGVTQAITNALAVGWPLEVDAAVKARDQKHPKFTGKNFLLFPEEFFKGPVMDRRRTPPWLNFLGQSQNVATTGTSAAPTAAADNPAATNTAPQPAASSAPTASPPRPAPPPSDKVMDCRTVNIGVAKGSGRQYSALVESLRKTLEPIASRHGIPLEFALAWLSHESGGSLTSWTTLNERGPFQIMGPHVDPSTGKFIPLSGTEAGTLGLTLADTGKDAYTPLKDARLSSDLAFSLDAGMRMIKQSKMPSADNVVTSFHLNWTEGDYWRLVKAAHNGMGFWVGTTGYAGFLNVAKQQLGHTPVSWEEMFNAVWPTIAGFTGLQHILQNATGVGGVVPTASGKMITSLDTAAGTAPTGTPPPRHAAGASATTAPTTSTSPTVTAAALAQANTVALDVFHLYAKFEYFRERYAARTGSVRGVWNPYIVPGFPGVVFDQRASRVDLMVYITTVQQLMSHDGKRQTDISFLYGRQLQELFTVLSDEFNLNNATSRGSGPEEPIRDVSKVVQSFAQAEVYYKKLFYGNQALFGKDASFDFRKIVAIQAETPGQPPTPIVVDGPDVVTQDAAVAAAENVKALTAQRDKITATIADLQSRIKERQDVLAALTPTPPTAPTDVGADKSAPGDDAGSLFAAGEETARKGAQDEITALQGQLDAQQRTLTLVNNLLTVALTAATTTASSTSKSPVTHNLDKAAAGVLVPAPSAQALFDTRDAALRYNWRPICTLDEYIIFYDGAGEGPIPPFGHARSVGARFFERIRRYTPLTKDTTFPPGADGLGDVASVPGLSSSNFPQIRADWDVLLTAYRNNVLKNKNPRT